MELKPICYADYGIIIMENDDIGSIEEKFWHLEPLGIILSKKKKDNGKIASGIVEDGQIKFLSLTYNYLNDTILNNKGNWINRSIMTDKLINR